MLRKSAAGKIVSCHCLQKRFQMLTYLNTMAAAAEGHGGGQPGDARADNGNVQGHGLWRNLGSWFGAAVSPRRL